MFSGATYKQPSLLPAVLVDVGVCVCVLGWGGGRAECRADIPSGVQSGGSGSSSSAYGVPNEPKTNPSFVEGEGTDDEWLVRLDFFLRRARASAAASCEITRTTPYVHNVEHVRGTACRRLFLYVRT